MYFLGLGTFICLVYFSPQNRTVGNILSLFSFYKKSLDVKKVWWLAQRYKANKWNS